MSGKWQQKTTSSNFNFPTSTQFAILSLILAGSTAIVLHKTLRWPLDMPGRHGLEFMAIFVFLRLASQQKWAATIAAFGGAITLGLISSSQSSAIGMLIILAQGVTLDLLYKQLTWRGKLLFLMPVIAAISHMVKPLLKTVAQFNIGIISDSLNTGLLTPLLSHALFGFIGGLFGLLGWQAFNKTR